jgi:hypothetical protein
MAGSGSIATKNGDYVLVNTAPDVCLTKVGKKWRPIPYNITHTMANSENVSPNVFAGGKPAFMHGESFITGITGDEPGRRGGIVTGTLTEISFALDKSASVYVNGMQSVRTGDSVWMNQQTPAAKQGKVGPDKECSWLKVIAFYDDLWKTPVHGAPLVVKVGGKPIMPMITLSDGGKGTNSVVSSKAMAIETQDEAGTYVAPSIDPENVEVEGGRIKGLEQAIVAQREGLEMTLDGAYWSTQDAMLEFQGLWDQYGKASLAISLWDGVSEGAKEWFEDSADLFTEETWESIKDTLSNASRNMFDSAVSNFEGAFTNYKEAHIDAIKWGIEGYKSESPWNWFTSELSKGVSYVDKDLHEKGDALKQAGKDAVAFGKELFSDAEKLIDVSAKIYKHQDEIINCINYFAASDISKIEHFIDTVVVDIFPEYVPEIRDQSGNISAAIEVLQDDSARLYMVYLSLIFDAVPPNFYVYIGGKGAAYILIELILCLILAIFSVGTGLIARLLMISARILKMGTKAAAVNSRIKNGQRAVENFCRNITDFIDATKQLKAIGSNLAKTRTKGMKTQGAHGQTLEMRKETKKQEARCRLCGGTDHHTPRDMHGSVKYI